VRKTWTAAVVLCLVTMAVVAAAQVSFPRSIRGDNPTVDYNSHFAFTRIRYGAKAGLGRRMYGGWWHDYPAADKNFSAILDYITNMRVRMDGSNILDLDDPLIFENPIIYMSEPGFWFTDDDEAKNLRAYLLKGGFIIFDDFEGSGQWDNLVTQMKRALPDHRFIKIDVNHPIFHAFFSIKYLNVPHPYVNVPPDYFAIFENNDPSGRMMALANYNNDLGDYWEWSAEGLYGTDPTNDAYRLGVNYIVYAMTH
jgi:hypothetical protein